VFIVSIIVYSDRHILQFLHQMFNVSALLLDDALLKCVVFWASQYKPRTHLYLVSLLLKWLFVAVGWLCGLHGFHTDDWCFFGVVYYMLLFFIISLF